jgi:hypothetical protein
MPGGVRGRALRPSYSICLLFLFARWLPFYEITADTLIRDYQDFLQLVEPSYQLLLEWFSTIRL